MPEDTAVQIHFQLHPSPRTTRPGPAPAVVQMPSRGRLPRLTQVLALAIHFEDLIRRQEADSYAELARLGGVTRERMSQIMKLTWLAPDIQQEILYLPPTPGGRYPLSEFAVRKIANELDWGRQREHWHQLKTQHRLSQTLVLQPLIRESSPELHPLMLNNPPELGPVLASLISAERS